MANAPSRRDVLRGAAAAAAGLALGQSAIAQDPQAKSRPAGKRVRFACIGVTGKGWSDMTDCAAHGDVVALCDPDLDNRVKAMREHPTATAFSDYREMLHVLHGEIDAVTV